MKSLERTFWDEDSSLGVCIDWFGPYTSYAAFKADIEFEDPKTKLVYFAEDAHGIAQYVGITESPGTRFAKHHKLNEKSCKNFWFGTINSQGKSGRRTKKGNSRPSTAQDLDQAETALVNWLWPEFNEQKQNLRPKQSISIANRFFTTDETLPMPIRGPEALPRILFYDWISNRYTVLHD